MITKQLRTLQRTRDHLKRLERQIAAKLKKELISLPAQYGYDSPRALYAAINQAQIATRKAQAVNTPTRKRKRKTKIADRHRFLVGSMAEAGATNQQIIKRVKLSRSAVSKIKKALKLSKPRKPGPH